MATVAAWVEQSPQNTVVHIDPFDPGAAGSDGRSALDLAEHLAAEGTGLVYWYGYSEPSQAAWAYRQVVRTGVPVWCADAMVVDGDGRGAGGDLGIATTPGVGCGVVLANINDATVERCRLRARVLASVYEGATLLDGRPGAVRFTSQARLRPYAV